MKKILSILTFLFFAIIANAQFKVQILYVGDSETRGIGTTGTLASSTNPATIGLVTYPLQSARMLQNSNVTALNLGYSGQTAAGYYANQMNADIAKIDLVNNNMVIVVLAFGTNDCRNNDTIGIYNNIIACVNAFKNAGAKVIVVPPLNRGDIYTTSTYNFTRLNLYDKFKRNLAAFDGFADLANQSNLWDSARVYNAKYFTQADVDGLNYVHYNDDGAALVAHEVTSAIEVLIGAYSGNINTYKTITSPYQSRLVVTGNAGTTPTLQGGKFNIPPTPSILTGNASPTVIPVKVGDQYIDVTNKKIYVATGITTTADWIIVN